VLSVCRFTDSDHPFIIFKFFFPFPEWIIYIFEILLNVDKRLISASLQMLSTGGTYTGILKD